MRRTNARERRRRLRRLLRAGLANRLGLWLLALSGLIAAALGWLPFLAPLAGRWLEALALGLVAYVATVVVTLWPAPAEPRLGILQDLRRSMAERLAELKAAESAAQSPLIPILAEAVQRMDQSLIPTFREIVVRHDDLSRHLERYERGSLTPPDPAILARLRLIQRRQEESIAACEQQAANVYATLVMILQQVGQDVEVAEQAWLWASDLLDIHDGLLDVLSGGDPYEQALARLDQGDAESSRVLPLLEAVVARDEPPALEPAAAAHLGEAAGVIEAAEVQVVEPPPITPPAEAAGAPAVAPPAPRPVEQPAAPAPAAPAGRRVYPAGLTAREVEVLRLVAEGKTSKEIADELVLTVATVSRHIANIYNKIDARGRADATRFAFEWGIARGAGPRRGDGPPDRPNGQRNRPPAEPAADLEAEVVRRLGQGQSVAAIAAALGLSPAAVNRLIASATDRLAKRRSD